MLTTKYDHAVAKRKQERERIGRRRSCPSRRRPATDSQRRWRRGRRLRTPRKHARTARSKMVARMTVMANRLGKGRAADEPTPQEEESV